METRLTDGADQACHVSHGGTRAPPARYASGQSLGARRRVAQDGICGVQARAYGVAWARGRGV